MTPEMLDEIEDGLIDRTDGFCFRITLEPDTSNAAERSSAFGVVIVDARGCALVVECRIGDDGTAQVTASKHTEDGSRYEPFVFTVDGSVMVTT